MCVIHHMILTMKNVVMSYGIDINMRQVACVKMRQICVSEKMAAIFKFLSPQQIEKPSFKCNN